MNSWVRTLLAIVAFAMASPSLALLPSTTGPAEAAETASDQTIDNTQDAGADERIAERINGIFDELPAFAEIDVAVSEGVVTLSGTVSEEADVARAEALASRIDGVVTVENGVERSLDVSDGIGVLASASEKLSDFVEMLPLILLAIGVAIALGTFGYIVASFGAFWRRITPNAFLAELVASAIRFAFIVLGLVVALDMIGAGALLGAVLGGAGVIGIALGFAMRDTIENYVASLMLSLRQPFRANDHVLVDDKEGHVIRLTSRATVLMTPDGNHMRIPNSEVFKATILNFTRNPHRRFSFELGIDADDDPRGAMALGQEVMRDLTFVVPDPEPSARIQQVGDSNIVIQFLAWVDQREADWNKSRSLTIAAVKQALEDAGFALPEPIYRLRFDGRTDPLPIGRSAQVRETTAQPPRKPKASAATQADHDVRPETEIKQMVDTERRSDGEQADDLLDEGRPVE